MIGKSQARMRLCVALLIVNLAFIWGNSLLPASASDALSRWVRDVLGAVFPGSSQGGDRGHGFLRKLAHFCEFCSLGGLLAWLYGMQRKTWRRAAVSSIGCAAAAACLDETIQIVSPGRYPSILDVGLDTAGAAVGITVLWTGYMIYKKRKMNDTTNGGKQQ